MTAADKKPKVIKVTQENVNSWLVCRQGFLENSLILLFGRQVEEDEQELAQSIHHNQRGFNKRNAKAGSEMCQKVLQGGTLSSAERTRARDICFDHARQIAKMMNDRAECVVAGKTWSADILKRV